MQIEILLMLLLSTHKFAPMNPVRKCMPHQIPSWVPEGSKYFITINCQHRGMDQLCRNEISSELLHSIPVYEAARKWHVYACMIMPDHLHLIAAFSKTYGIRSVISSWKSYQARHLNIKWQYNYFEHRLRNEAEFTEKMHYVLMNPVRKALVDDWRKWPHKFARGVSV